VIAAPIDVAGIRPPRAALAHALLVALGWASVAGHHSAGLYEAISQHHE